MFENEVAQIQQNGNHSKQSTLESELSLNIELWKMFPFQAIWIIFPNFSDNYFFSRLFFGPFDFSTITILDKIHFRRE